MALKNATHDLTTMERAAIAAAAALGHARALTGDPTPHADEVTQFSVISRALRGRGCTSPLGILLGEYDKGESAAQFGRSIALACAATPGELDFSRTQEGT